MITALDHVNIRTARVDLLTEWYSHVLGLTSGPRPPFPFGGAWLYVGDTAAVHLIEVDAAEADAAPAGSTVRLEHFAFRAEGLATFLERLEQLDIAHRLGRVPEFGIVQVNLWDPDGNHLHVDFSAAEAEAAGL